MKRSIRKPLLIAAAVLAIDQLLKWLVKSIVPPEGAIAIVTNAFYISLVTNTGAAFSILTGRNTLLMLVSVAAIGVIIYYLKTEDKRYSTGLGLILGGVLGNLVDRATLGHVVDFIDFTIWPVFNIADTAITIGAVLIVYQAYLKEKIEKL